MMFSYPEVTTKELLKELKKRIRKGWGKKCPDFDINCASCQQWLALDILQITVDMEELEEKENMGVSKEAKKVNKT